MLLQAVKALIWEVLRKRAIGLCLVLFIVPILWKAVEYYLLSSFGVDTYFPAGKLSFAVLTLSVLFLYVTFSYVETNSQDKFADGFPRHILRLPVPTWVLAIVPILLGTIFVSGFNLLWINLLTDFEISGLIQFTICGVAGAFIAWSQAIHWGINTPMFVKVILLLLVVSGLVFSVLNIFNVDHETDTLKQGYGALGLIFLLIGGYLFSFYTLIRTRRGDGYRVFENRKILEKINVFDSVTHLRYFPNGLKAQFWYEWNILAFVVPLTIAIISIFEIIAVLFGAPQKIILPVLMTSTFCFIFSSYFMACNKLGSDKVNILPHCATRPLSDFDLALTKLLPHASAILLGFLIYIVTPLIVLSIVGIPELDISNAKILSQLDITDMLCAVVLATVLLISIFWLISANVMAVLLMDRKLVSYGMGVAYFVCMGLILWCAIYLKGEQKSIQSTEVFIVVQNNFQLTPLIFTSIIISFILFLIPLFRKVAKLNELKTYGVICMGVLIVCLGLLWSLDIHNHIQTFSSYSLLNIALLCFLPFIIAPISIAKNRHR